MRLTRRSKYGNTRTRIGDKLFGSKKEASRFQVLEIFQEAGEISELQFHPRYKLSVGNIKIGVYEADASYVKKGETRTTVEDTKPLCSKTMKPLIDKMARWKHKHFKAQYPQHEFEIYA